MSRVKCLVSKIVKWTGSACQGKARQCVSVKGRSISAAVTTKDATGVRTDVRAPSAHMCACMPVAA